MFSGETTDYWYLQSGLSIDVNFCVWVLLVDGLRVPPFDRHPDGSGQLRAAGMSQKSWYAWFSKVLGTAVDIDPKQPWPQVSVEDLAMLSQYADPPRVWTGEPAVGECLTRLWDEHREHYDDWIDRNVGEVGEDPRLPPPLSPAQHRDLWQSLVSFHNRLPTLEVQITEYPWPVVCTVPPVHVILGIDNGALDSDKYAAAILHGAYELARPGTGQPKHDQ